MTLFNLMAKYHFSAKFSDSTFSYHGEFNTVLKDTADIVKKAKIEFKRKCEVWQKNPALVARFEIYRYSDEGEQQVFEFGA